MTFPKCPKMGLKFWKFFCRLLCFFKLDFCSIYNLERCFFAILPYFTLSFEKCRKMAICTTFEYPPISNDSGSMKFTTKIGHFWSFSLNNPFTKYPRTTSFASFETLSISGILEMLFSSWPDFYFQQSWSSYRIPETFTSHLYKN